MRISKLTVHWISIDCSTRHDKKGAHDLQSTFEESALQWDSLPDISEQTRENMKTVILALVVLLVVSQGEALRCYCGGRTHCSRRIQTCSGSNKVCARITFTHDYSYFQSCYDVRACRGLINSSGYTGRCCLTDLCN